MFQKVYRMVQAAQHQSTAPIFWKYQFLLAVTMAREIGGHLLMTFLSKGEDSALGSTRIAAKGYFNPQARSGESGHMFELRLFGGSVEVYRENNFNTSDVRQIEPPITSKYRLTDSSLGWKPSHC